MPVPLRFLPICALIAPLAAMGEEEPTVVESHIESIGLFKNGMFVVREDIPISGPGVYRLDSVPKAFHGSIWFESELPFEVHTAHREETLPGRYPRDFVEAVGLLGGTTVSMELSDGEKLSGRIAPLKEVGDGNGDEGVITLGGLVPIETVTGTVYLQPSRIRSFQSSEPASSTIQYETRKIAVLEFRVGEGPVRDSVISMSYLAEGAAWAPSYRVDYDGGGTGRIRLSTVVRNDWRDLRDTRVELISGFPRIEYSGMTSPLSHELTWSSFFSQLSGPGGTSSGRSSQLIFSNTVSFVESTALSEGFVPMAGGEDLHFMPIGMVTLAKGSSYGREISEADVPMVRFVEWRISDHRDSLGRSQGFESRGEPWDTVRLVNPFDGPITTAPIAFWFDGQFRGQATTTFVNPGGEALIRVTKSLSVETRHEESLVERGEIITIHDYDYEKMVMRADMRLVNRRENTTTVEITRNFQGEMRSATVEPRRVRTTAGGTNINSSNEAHWSIDMAPGEERVISMDYELLVRRSEQRARTEGR